MAKIGMSKDQVRSLLSRAASGPGWVLCVGAGISKPAFPDWNELVRRLAVRDPEPPSSEALSQLQKTYSPDALIQAAMDRLSLSQEQFASVLAQELYHDITEALSARGHSKLCTDALTARHITDLKRRSWQEFIDALTMCFPSLTSLKLARTLSAVLGTQAAPTAILSFNAEPLFAALINANVAAHRGLKGGDVLDVMVHATSDRRAGRVPYVFCHGLLPIPGRAGQSLSSVDKLVFLEAAYLQLANTSFSWQSSSFLRAAAGGSILFVGVSLTDPNMRRWLAWVHAIRTAELRERGVRVPMSTTHYWIARDPQNRFIARWTESLVAHLGVRLIWIEDYGDVSPILDLMLR